MNNILFAQPNSTRMPPCPPNQCLTLDSPIAIISVTKLGDVQSQNTEVRRDLGFQGQIGPYVLLTYGDTLFGNQEDEEFRGMTCNSIAFATFDPCRVYDPVLDESGFPRCIVPPSKVWGEDPCEYALGLTGVVETYPDCGILFFLLNHRPHGQNNLIGAGVARIHLDRSYEPPKPTAIRLTRYMWKGNCEPWFGDVCVARFGEYIYTYGHMRSNSWVYLARVKWQYVEIVNEYEYWHGNSIGWDRKRLFKDEVGEEQSVFWQVQQGQVIWSKHHNQYLFIYADNFWSCQILMKTATSPEGPWSEPTTVYKPAPLQRGGNVYSPVPHPYFDLSGRTLVITFTNHPNCIQAIRVDFDEHEATSQSQR